MSGTGRVIAVDLASVPNTNRPARLITVDRDSGERLQFYTPREDVAPTVGDVIGWGPRHAQFAGHRVKKLSNEIDPAAPLT
ncbi:hypothetical protein [Sphingomonas melonis]|uniref:Uncharacterized protein n=1 Tax=Sphingomonas melonis TaxID=152682 RepID=A0A7Y9FK03_9SPHN|nr:hypothetical protein [Sphingomonas melonis]NYD88736.1 hypothetical protein [Sphingomonas melonis]